jgi:hypothetical protein
MKTGPGRFVLFLRQSLALIGLVGLPAITHAATVATPTFSPVAGTYTSAQSVTITTTTSGASIRYTTDGSTPSATAGTVYASPISISANTTLKAIAYETGFTNSAVKSGTYSIKVIAPVFSPVAGTYTSAQSVTITSATSGASINYTTDGSTPSETNGTVYSGPVSISANTTLKAIAYETGLTDSSVASGIYSIKVIAPVFSPVAGTYTSPQMVTMTSATSGVSFAYTTDGTTPTESGGTVTNGMLYSGPVSITANTTLKAIAYETGLTDSSVTSGTYSIKVVAPVFSPAAGTYTGPQSVVITCTTSGASINYTTDGTTPSTTNGTVYSGPVLISATTTLKAIAYETGLTNSSVTSGTYTIKAAAPVFSPVGGTYTSAQAVAITSATSGATINYTTDGTTPSPTNGIVYSAPVSIGVTTTLKAIAYETGLANSSVTSGTYTINLPTVATPVFSPAAGTYTSVQTVKITTTTSGATIRYTTDGSTPSATAGNLYSGPLTLGSTTTLKAIAYEAGFKNSAIKSGLYTINLPTAAAPVFSPAPGAFPSAQSVTITTTTSGATIRYTTDGSTPSETTGNLYSGPLALSSTTTLKAIAYKSGYNDSTVTGGTYTITPPPTITSPLTATGQVGAAFSYQITASNSPTSYNATGLPPGLNVDTSTGLITGTPTTAGTSNITISASNSGGTGSATLVLTVNPEPVTFTISPVSFTYNGSAQGPTITPSVAGATYTTSGTASATSAGSYTVTVTATGNYTGNSGAISWTIAKATPVVSWPPPAPIVYGTPFDSTELNATADVPGTFAYAPSAGTVLDVGTQTLSVTFTPADATDYTNASASVSLTVNPEPVTFTIAPVSFTYNGSVQGPTITPSVAGATYSIGGTASATAAGSYTVTATATGNYTGTSGPITWTIAQATPVVSWPTPAPIVYGMVLDSTELNATANVPGTFAYNPPANTVLGVGTQTLSVEFTPTDAADYANASASVSLTVNPPPAAAPLFSPAPGTYDNAQTVAITTTTNGATIRYTTDGSTPTETTGNIYSGPLTLSATTTLQAIAYAAGFTDSPVTGGIYSILPAAAAPVFSPVAGTYANAQTVTITSPTSGASIAYTTDGSTPTESGGSITNGTLYGSPLSISATTTLQAIAYAAGFTDSPVASATYAINQQPTTITPIIPSGGLTFGSSNNVSLSFNASDDTGSIASVVLSSTDPSVPAITLTSPTSGSTWTFTEPSLLSPGTYTFTATATDNSGATTTSPPVTVTVLASLPYLTDFEAGEGYILGSLNQQLGWIVNQGSASVTNQDFFSGSHSVVLQPGTSPAQITQSFVLLAGQNIIYVDFFAKPVAEADVTTATTFNIGSARFAFVLNGGQGTLQAFNGDGSGGGSWSSANFTASLGANNQSLNWIRLTARLDFAHQTWDLYANGNMVAADLGFLDSSIALTSFSVQGDAATGSEIDDILACPENPLFSDGNNDGIDDDWEIVHGLDTSVNDRYLNPTNNGQTVLQDYLNGIDPADYYGGVLPVITSLVDPSGVPGTQGLVSVKVTRASDGMPLANAPITFAVTTRASQISATSGGIGSTQVTVLADATGIAQAYVTFASQASDTLLATAQSGNQASSISINIRPPSPPSLSYTTNLEASEGYTLGSLDQQLGWSVTQGAASVTSQEAFSGSQSVVLAPGATPAQIAHTFSAVSGESIVYVDFYAKPVAEADVTTATTFNIGGARFAFMLNGIQGNLQAFYGYGFGGYGNWTPTNFNAPLAANNQSQNWIRLTVRLNFTRQQWDLYANGQMVAADQGFFESSTALTTFSVQGDAATASEIDDISVGSKNPLFADINNDGIDDTWETAHDLSLTINDRYLDPTGNGHSVVQDYINGTDPNDIYNGVLPVITSLVDPSGVPGSQGLVSVYVTDTSGNPLPNAPLTFAITIGDGEISATPGGNGARQVNVLTNYSGIAQAYVNFGALTSNMLVVTAQSGTQTTSISINLNLSLSSGSLLYTSDFETSEGYTLGPLGGQQAWSVPQGAALVTSQDAFSGSQSVVLQPGATPAQIVQAFPAYAGQDIIFVDFYAKPVAETDVATATSFNVGSARFAFVLNDSGQGILQAFSGDGSGGGNWTPTNFIASLAANHQVQNWTRLTARLDFTHQTWDLYADGHMVAADLGFLDNTSTALTTFWVQGDASIASKIDDLSAGSTNPLFTDVNNDGIDDNWEALNGLNLSVNDRYLNFLGSSITVVQQYINDADYYNGALPVITSLIDPSGAPGSQGLVSVKVTRASDGAPLANAPLTFTVTTGASQVSATPAGTGSTQVSVVTNSSGIAQAYVKFTGSAPAVLVVMAQSGGQTTALSIPIIPPPFPYVADFEKSGGYALGPLAGQQGWNVPQGTALVTHNDAFSGFQSVVLRPGATPAQVTRPFPSIGGEGIMFANFYAKPVAETDLATATTFNIGSARFAFLLTSEGQGALQVFNGNGSGGGSWNPTNFMILLGPGNQSQGWIELTIRLDFTRQTWDLYANGQMVVADLGFINNSTALTNFSVQGDTSAASEIDYLSVGPDNPLFTDANNDGIDDNWEQQYNLSLSGNDRYLDPTNNGQAVLQDYINSIDPTDYYGGVLPVITSLIDSSGVPGAQGLVSVKVARASDGTPLASAPVTFTVTPGLSQISTTPGGAGSAQVTVTADASGIAQAYVTFASLASDVVVAIAQSGTQTTSLSVNINPATPSFAYTMGFEASEGYTVGPLDLQQGWGVLQGTASVTDQDAFSGSESVVLQPGAVPAQIVQTFPAATGENIVFADFYAKPVADTDVTTATTFNAGSARFAFVMSGDGQGTLQAFNGDGSGGGIWTSTKFTTPLAANNESKNWVRLTARLNFQSHSWDLYANGQMVAGDLGFLDSTSIALTTFLVQGDAATASGLDDVFIGTANPLFADINNDGIDDAWETAHNLRLSVNDRNLDPTNNGQTVLQDYVNGTDPNDFYNGIPPVITPLVGGAAGQPGPQGLISVLVTDSNGKPLVNAPVTFTLPPGLGGLSTTPGAPTSRQLTVPTDANGNAQAYDNYPSGTPDTPAVAPATGPGNSSSAGSDSVFIDLGKNMEPIAMAANGMITLGIRNTDLTNAYSLVYSTLDRWRAGTITTLHVPPGFFIYNQNDPADPSKAFYFSLNSINRNGLVAADAADSVGGNNAATEDLTVVWPDDSDTPFPIKGPVWTGHGVNPDNGNSPVSSSASGAGLIQVDNGNGVWVEEQRTVEYGDPWYYIPKIYTVEGGAPPSGQAIFGSIVINDFGASLAIFGINAQHQAVGFYSGNSGASYYFVGTPDNKVDFTPFAINDAGQVLGDASPGSYGRGVLEADTYGAPLLQSPLNYGIGTYSVSPFVLTGSTRQYLQGVPSAAGALITGFDEAGNVYGSIGPDFSIPPYNPGRQVIWVAKPTDWGLPDKTPAYTPIPWEQPMLPAGYTSLYGVQPGARRIELGLATKTEADGTTSTHGFALIPVELDLVNRDDLTKTWADEQKQSGLVTVYAGTTTGDMVEWKPTIPAGWEKGTFTWTATDSNGNVINGPTGVGVDNWQISDQGNDPKDKTSLTWKPDTYTIKCNIAVSGGNIPLQFTQKVGWRTEDYLVIGQIVNTNTYDKNAPVAGSDSDYIKAISYDIADNLGLEGNGFVGWVLPPGSKKAVGTLLDTGIVPDSWLGMMELGFWGSVAHGSTPPGPFTESSPEGLGYVKSNERWWMLQNGLNFSVDLASGAPSEIPANTLSSIKGQQQYRLFHHYQTRFCLTSFGTIDTTTLYDIHKDAQLGPTKINWQIAAGTYSVTILGTTFSNPQIGPFTIPSEANQKNGSVQTSFDGTQRSSFASGRIGLEGQNANWRLFGKDVPWIFSEIFCEVASDHTVTSTIMLSVDKIWQPEPIGFLPDGHNFNNLSIYKATIDPRTGTLNYLPQPGSPISMNGQVEPFIDSIPYGKWPSLPPAPFVQ